MVAIGGNDVIIKRKCDGTILSLSRCNKYRDIIIKMHTINPVMYHFTTVYQK